MCDCPEKTNSRNIINRYRSCSKKPIYKPIQANKSFVPQLLKNLKFWWTSKSRELADTFGVISISSGSSSSEIKFSILANSQQSEENSRQTTKVINSAVWRFFLHSSSSEEQFRRISITKETNLIQSINYPIHLQFFFSEQQTSRMIQLLSSQTSSHGLMLMRFRSSGMIIQKRKLNEAH